MGRELGVVRVSGKRRDLRSLIPSKKNGAKMKPASVTSSFVSTQFAKGGERHSLAPK